MIVTFGVQETRHEMISEQRDWYQHAVSCMYIFVFLSHTINCKADILAPAVAVDLGPSDAIRPIGYSSSYTIGRDSYYRYASRIRPNPSSTSIAPLPTTSQSPFGNLLRPYLEIFH